MRTNRLLVVDDEQAVCTFVQDVAIPIGFDVRIATDGVEFLHLCEEFQPTTLIVDLQMPNVDGIELLHCLAKHQSSARVILMSGMDAKVLGTAQRLGREYGLTMVGLLQKPIMLEDLEQLLFQCLNGPSDEPLDAEAIQGALRRDELRVFYQPIINLRVRDRAQPVAAEALLRWQHPSQGLLMPASFLDLIHSSGLMWDVTDFVLRTVIEQISAWKAGDVSIKVSVNLDPSLINDLEFPDRLLAPLREFDVDPSDLLFEVTERGALAHVAKSMNVLTRLRLKGIDLAIDDFGTGNSSLIQLHQMPFSELKIDRSFVGDMLTNDDSKIIVRALIDLAHNLDMTVCAEGVESREVMDSLAEMGCDRAQGYLFAQAMAPDDLITWLNGWNADAPSVTARPFGHA